MCRKPSSWQVGRILDAAGNRAAEGLRTLEEFARFVLEDRLLTAELKTLRHDLQRSLAAIPAALRLTSRAVSSDIGTRITVADERQRADLPAVIAAAAGRAQQALRCLEEYGKTVSPPLAAELESLRYRLYTVAAAVQLMPRRQAALADSRLYLLIPGDEDAERFSRSVGGFFAAGVDIIQLRDKSLDDAQLYRLSRRGAEIARQAGKTFIVNDRADIAVASGAQGVHVGQEELPVEAVRRVVGPERLIGVSTHHVDQARAALLDGADYLGCGPTFPSSTKSFVQFAGLEYLRQVRALTTLPAFAIGGISGENVEAVMETGIGGIAVAGAILAATDPVAAAAALKRRLVQSAAAAADETGSVP